MTIHGIGTDIVASERIRQLLARYPDRLPKRLLTAGEQADLPCGATQVAFLAKRFAAKEAAAKALGTGFASGVRFTDFEIGHEGNGRPSLSLLGHAAAVAAEMRITACHLSISDEQQFAVAFVVFEGDG